MYAVFSDERVSAVLIHPYRFHDREEFPIRVLVVDVTLAILDCQC